MLYRNLPSETNSNNIMEFTVKTYFDKFQNEILNTYRCSKNDTGEINFMIYPILHILPTNETIEAIDKFAKPNQYVLPRIGYSFYGRIFPEYDIRTARIIISIRGTNLEN